MVSRFYFTPSGTSAIAPAVAAGWERSAANFYRNKMPVFHLVMYVQRGRPLSAYHLRVPGAPTVICGRPITRSAGQDVLGPYTADKIPEPRRLCKKCRGRLKRFTASA